MVSSDICNYEIRRGLILISINQNKPQNIDKLDSLHEIIDFLPVGQDVLKKQPSYGQKPEAEENQLLTPKILMLMS